MKTSDFKSFHYLENGEIAFSPFETIKTGKILDEGSYKMTYVGYPVNQVRLKADEDFEIPKVHNFSDKTKIDLLFKSFFEPEILKKVVDLGFCHKTGILLHGIEGTGKSTIIKYYCDLAIKNNNALVFHMLENSSYIAECWDFVQNIRRIQDNPIIIVFDEFDQQMKNNEAFLKTVLDGNMSINNCIFFAATNYLDSLPKAMKDRPSRFKYSLNIEGMQVTDDIVMLITKMLDELYSKEEIEVFAVELKGKTLDHIKQYCLDKIMNLSHSVNKVKRIGFAKV